MKKISIFLICSLLMIFGLSFSACADAVTTGGVTAVVTPRPVDSLGNEKQVEFATSAKAETTTTTETTTTKPAYNQEEMKKDLEDLGKEDMVASAVGIFAWVKGLVDWTQGIINTLGIYIKAGIDSPWGFDLNGFVDLFAPFFKTIGYGILVLLFGINLIHSAMQFELVNYKGVIKILVGLLLAKLWVDLSTDICIALIDTCTDIASSVFTSADEMIVFPSFDTLKSTDTGLWIIGELLNQLLDIVLLAPIIIVALAILIICGLIMIKLMLRTFELALYCSVSPAFFACLLGDATKGYFKRFIDGLAVFGRTESFSSACYGIFNLKATACITSAYRRFLMIKCKVTKKIMQESGTIMGLSIIQIVTLIIGCIVTIGSLLLLWLVLKVGIDAVMWIVFLELVLFIGFGVVRIQGMSVLKFITSNSTQKRPYNSKGVFNNVDNR